ncbi:MAG TPA: hypothetical protein VGC21_13945 [Telluria sp.]|jgi:hypothetical protein
MDTPDDEKMDSIIAGVQHLVSTLSCLVSWMSGAGHGRVQATAMLLARARYTGERYMSEHEVPPDVRGKLLDLLETVRELDSCSTSLVARSGSDIERYLAMASGARHTLAEIIDDLGYVARG